MATLRFFKQLSQFHTCLRCGEPLEFVQDTNRIVQGNQGNQRTRITAVCSCHCEGTYTIESKLINYPSVPKERNGILIHEGNVGTTYVLDNVQTM